MDPSTRKQFAAKVKAKYPQYASVPDDQLVNAIVAKYPQYKESIIDYGGIPAGQHISTGPHGVDKLKQRGFQLRDLLVNNLDVAGGAAGGLLGASAGGPPGAVGGATLGGGAGRALTQLINTGRGQPMPSSGEAAKDIAIGGVEQGGLELTGLGLSKLGKAIKPAERSSLLAYGTRSGELTPQIEKVIPDLDRMASRMGKPKSIGELDNLLHATERGLNQEFNAALFPIAQQPVAAHPVAQAIRAQITPNMAKTSEGRAMQNYLMRRATEFDQGTWTIAELNRERELVTKRLRAYHNAISTGQTASARVHANIAADTAAENALKDMLYNAADQSGVKPAGYFKALKQRQSDLISFQDSVKAAKDKLVKASSERKGAPLSEKIHLRGYLHPQSITPSGVAGISPSMFSDPLAQADKAISKGFPQGTQSIVRGARTAAGTAISNPDVNALPLRLLFGDYAETQEKPEQ